VRPADATVVDERLSATFRAPDDAVIAYFYLRQDSSQPAEQIGFDATAILLENDARLREFADGDTPGWRALEPRYDAPSVGPGFTAQEIERQLLARVPAGLSYDVVISDHRDYAEIVARIDESVPTYAEIATRYDRYADLLED
jgi:hypothetical protein